MPSLGIAPHPGGCVGLPVHANAGCGTGFRRLSGGSARFTGWRLGFRQSSFRHITRVRQRPIFDAFAMFAATWHAIVPLTFRIKVSH
jgi:hypothetical protein